MPVNSVFVLNRIRIVRSWMTSPRAEEKHGISVWYDNNLRGGAALPQNSPTDMDRRGNARWSWSSARSFNQSDWTWKEIIYAQKQTDFSSAPRRRPTDLA